MWEDSVNQSSSSVPSLTVSSSSSVSENEQELQEPIQQMNYLDTITMADDLWRHALDTLDEYRLNSGVIGEQLYRHDDSTGILRRHQESLARSRHKAEPKAMYFELIKMLLQHEKSHCKPEAYQQVKEVSKIQGYQDLTNRLLRNVNERLVQDLAVISQKLERVEKVVAGLGDGMEDEESSLGQKLKTFEIKLDRIEKDSSQQNDDIMSLQDALRARDDVDSGLKQMQEEQVNVQKLALETLEQRLDKNEEHIRMMQEHDLEQDDKLHDFEDALPNLENKLTALESADTYLQEAHKDAVRKVQSIEEDVQTKGRDMDDLINDFKEYKEAKQLGDDKAVVVLEELSRKELELNASVAQLNEDNKDIKDKLESLHEGSFKLEERARDLLEDMNKTKQTDADREKDVNEKMVSINDEIQKLFGEVDNLKGVSNNNTNDLKVLHEGADNVHIRIGQVENEAKGAVQNIWEAFEDSKQNFDDKLNEIRDNVQCNSEKVHSLQSNDNIVVAKLEQVEMEVRQQNQDASKANNYLEEKLTKLDEDLKLNIKRIDDGNNVIRSHTEQLYIIEPLANDTSIQVEELKKKAGEFDRRINELHGKEENHEKLLEELQRSKRDIDGQLEKLDDDAKLNLEKIISLEEANITQLEKVTYVDILQSQLSAMDEAKQQSEAKLKEDMDKTVQDNKETLEELKQVFGQKLDDHSNQLGGLWDQNQKVHDGLRLLTENGEDHTHKLNDLHKAKDDIFTRLEQSLGEHNNNIDQLNSKITELNTKTDDTIRDINDVLKPRSNEHNETLSHLRQRMDDIPGKIMVDVAYNINDMSVKMDEKMNEIQEMKEQTEKDVGNLRDLNDRLIKELKDKLQCDISEQRNSLEMMREEYVKEGHNLRETINNILEKLSQFNQEDIDELLKARHMLQEKLEYVQSELDDVNGSLKTHSEFMNDIKDKNDVLSEGILSLQRDDVDCLKEAIHELKLETERKDKDLEKMNQDISNIHYHVGDVSTTITPLHERMSGNTKDTIRIRKDIAANKQDLWRLVLEVYGALRGCTVLLRSNGNAAEHQPACLGVYRMVDSFADRPVYKQDGGENYLYYNTASKSWRVGTEVGAEYAWIYNDSEGSQMNTSDEGSDSDDSTGSVESGRRKKTFKPSFSTQLLTTPDLLHSGWKYKPRVLDFDGDSDVDDWMADDDTLTVEALKDIQKINEVIADIQKAREVD